ncbi:hypothetical protein [Serratia marcescens]|uniref:hypothetical protein n=1 Tax=Serratia marcescens TaxID=615 RepID=UPI000CAB727F|nr:hypothetical protein [Serratia marcescens]PKR39925.1 hypothetical protein CU560_18520 [Serratia ureilytica]QJU39026.1 hypothetical protein HMI62_06670 [Serratia marcescens]
MSMANDTYECCRRKCKLVHLHSERVMVEGKPIGGVPVKDSTCPRCGCKEFYIVKRDDEDGE